MKYRSFLVAVIGVALGVATGRVATGQETTAERTNFSETSTYPQVMRFLTTLQRSTGDIRVGTMARTTEGRDIPWVLAARPMVDGPIAAHRSGKPILYIQGNIHAGEVEGKEAAQMLLRDVTVGPLAHLLDSVILLVVPIYNADGNERFGPGAEHRPGQNGPAHVGLRPNGQGLDLNRDYIKMEAPETRGAARLINEWDPDFFIDLHTTNGSYHGYSLTYSPGLNPNGNAANDYIRETFLPTVRSRVRERHGQEMFWYGNFRNQNPDSLTQGWYTYDARPRFGTNWFAMRGRLAILSEGYSNAPFETRVRASYDFLAEILLLAAEERVRIAAIRAEVEVERPGFVAITARWAPPDTLPVIAEITEPDEDGAGPFARRTRTGTYRTVQMPVFHRFDPGAVVALPAGYLIPPSQPEVAALLGRHGVRLERLGEDWTGTAGVFSIDSVVAGRLFQGHRPVSLAGTWEERTATASRGWLWLSTDQRLGALGAYILEPMAADGAVTWNFLDRALRPGRDYPILRLDQPPMVEMTLVDSGP
jgi:hypothetical protein